MIVDGFDLDSDLVCEGIIGDGCGGGRIFFIKEQTLFAYDPITKESLLLLTGIKEPRHLSKKACIISIECLEKVVSFDLSLFTGDEDV